MGKTFRRKKFVNKQLQGQLMLKMVLHWLGYNAIVLFISLGSCMFLYCISIVNGVPERTMKEEVAQYFLNHRPMLIAMIILLPLIVWDMLKTSHRVAGPVYKFRAELQRFIDTGRLEPVKLRQGDFLMEFQDTWNEAVKKVNQQADQPASDDDVVPPSTSPSTTNAAESPTMAS